MLFNIKLLFLLPFLTKSVPPSPDAGSKIQEVYTGQTDFRVRIHAPEESTEETLDSLDSLLKTTEANGREQEDDMLNSKQRLLQIHKNRIREIVRSAFEPIHAMIPNPVTSAVKEFI